MVGESYNPRKKVYEIFEGSGTEQFYRGCYSGYCDYSHGGFLSGLSERELSKLDEYFSLISPVGCAYNLQQNLSEDEDDKNTGKMNLVIKDVGQILYD